MTIPDWMLERARHGELDPEQQARLDEALAADPDLRRRVEALDRDDDAFRAAHPWARVGPELERRAHLARTREAVGRRSRAVLGVLAVLVPLAAVALVVALPPSEPTVEEGVRVKGATRLVLHRKTADGAAVVASGDVARAGDVLQVSYVAGGMPYGVVLSIDGRGAVTLHHPSSIRSSTALSQEGEVPVPHALALDDAPRFERFFLVTGTEPIDVRAVLDAAAALADEGEARSGRLPLPPHLQQHDVLVVKVPR